MAKIGFPVYALGRVPSTSVGHYRFAGANIAVDGVTVCGRHCGCGCRRSCDCAARESRWGACHRTKNGFKEHSMYAYIEKLKSIEEAVKKFGRL
ncbi:MAG: hypothetical protein WB762_09695 [Candidatus Sulfotelmatobacter sp.]